MTIKISKVTLPVSNANQGRTKKLLCDTLGFKVLVENQVSEDACWVEVGPEEGTAIILVTQQFVPMAPGSVKGIMIETENFDADVEALRNAGVEVEERNTPWGRQGSFSEYDGNGLVLQEGK